jgi:hypothetical protein
MNRSARTISSLLASAALLTLAPSLSAAEEPVKQALIIEAPATWKVEFKGKNGLQFYTVTRKEGDTALLMLSRWPAPGNVNQIPETIESMAKAFVAQVKDQKDLKLKSTDYQTHEIQGGTFSGRSILFEIEGEICQTLFMVGDAEGIWNGQFTGSRERWTEALAILKNLKKNN